jgi:hypothetical protein
MKRKWDWKLVDRVDKGSEVIFTYQCDMDCCELPKCTIEINAIIVHDKDLPTDCIREGGQW